MVYKPTYNYGAPSCSKLPSPPLDHAQWQFYEGPPWTPRASCRPRALGNVWSGATHGRLERSKIVGVETIWSNLKTWFWVDFSWTSLFNGSYWILTVLSGKKWILMGPRWCRTLEAADHELEQLQDWVALLQYIYIDVICRI